MTNLQDLPEECIAKILSHTTPVDACRLSLVSKTFHSAAENDIVWDPFLPSDSSSIISLSSNSKKALYFTLPDFRLTIIDNGEKSFQLDKRTGKKCYMFSARDLTIESKWGNWTRSSTARLQESRFKNVAWLPSESFFSIDWTINTGILSPNTKYTAFLVFKLINRLFESKTRSVFDSLSTKKSSIFSIKKFSKILLTYIQTNSKSFTEISFVGGIGSGCTSATDRVERAIERRDGWLEIKIGSFNSGLKEDQVPLKVRSIRDIWTRCGFIIEGIEFRPRC